MKISIPQKLRLGVLVYNKKFTIILSIIVAFSLWLGIAMFENPIREQIFTDISAIVSIDNTFADENGALGIVSDVSSNKFTVTVSGSNRVVSSLKSEDISLYASTVDVDKPGTFELEIKSTNESNKSGYEIISIEPKTITVSFDYIDSKEFEIVPKLIGVSASEGLIAETPVVSDSQQSKITIKGPRTIMERIASVGTIAEVNRTLSKSQTFNSDIVLYDAEGEPIYRFTSDGTVYDPSNNIVTNSNLTLSFTSVKVTQPISKKKTVNCKLEFTNLPEGMSENDIRYTINHNQVTIIGTPEIVDNLEIVSLSPIDFKMISASNNKFELSAVLPDGVKILDNINVFEVEIDVSNYSEKELVITDIHCTNTGDGLGSRTDNSIRIKICGPADIIRDITANDVYIVLDLTDKKAGEHTIEVVLKSDKYDNIWQVGSYIMTVTIY